MPTTTEQPPLSLDTIDRASYNLGPSPLDSPAEAVSLAQGRAQHPEGAAVVSLDGMWQMAIGGTLHSRVHEPWGDAIPAAVPGSIHAALVKAGIIPDPSFGKLDAIAREYSFKTYFLKRTFSREEAQTATRLVFEGIALYAMIYLNGVWIGQHEGMFGGPTFPDITAQLQDENTLLVMINPAPMKPGALPGFNDGWKTTVTFNNVYGWHYSNIPSLGIWRSVRLEAKPTVEMLHPFVATRDAAGGLVDLVTTLRGAAAGWSGTLRGTIEPDNFEGAAHHFEKEVRSGEAEQEVHLQLTVPDPRLWWPVDMGEHLLYRMTLSFVPSGEGIADTQAVTFGIRTIEMAPLPGGPFPDKFNWAFVINGKKTFVKGTGWCTMDPLMDFSRGRYDWFLSLAAAQHIQMLRAWGCGMPETDDFYDLCDRKGIMVFQEWPTSWNSHQQQPYEVLEETVRLNTLRLRNHPSLALLSGGNESSLPFGPAIDMMGRLATEMDGTRAFHRGEPYGGSDHNYDAYWGSQHPDRNLTLTSHFWGEFGVACMPVYESVQKYLPDTEKRLWPPLENGVFAHHTPIFNTAQDMERQRKYSGYLTAGATMKRFIEGSQMSQVIGLRHTLELARTRWPECAGALYYKMNDNYPAASWSTADWYGAPKMGHYFCQDAFAPLHACVLLTHLDNTGVDVSWPVVLLDDADALQGRDWRVNVRAFGGDLRLIKTQDYTGSGGIGQVRPLGDFALTAQQTQTNPLLLVVEVLGDGVPADRTFYWLNYEPVQDCLFELPRAALTLSAVGKELTVTNTGGVPAVGVYFASPEHSESFAASDNYFWLHPAETKTVTATRSDGITVSAWNAETVGPGAENEEDTALDNECP